MTNADNILPQSRVRISPSVYARAFDTELVLLDFGRGEYFGLDEVGAEIWRRLEAGDSLGAIADAIVQRYDVERETAFHDIIDMVTRMSGHSLLTILDANGEAIATV